MRVHFIHCILHCVIPFYKVKTNLKCQKADQWLPGHTGGGLRNGVGGKGGGITAEHFKQQNLQGNTYVH